MDERASISKTTLHKIEKGNVGVSMGNYAMVLFILQMHEHIGDLADMSMISKTIVWPKFL